MRFLFAVLTLTVVWSAFAEALPLDRYAPIWGRQMFGPLPIGFDPDKLPSAVTKSKTGKALTQEQEKLKSAVHFSAINVRSDGRVEVGFSDNSNPKKPHHYFLAVGESSDGWNVVTADCETASMTIVKDDIQLELTLGDNSATGAGNASKVGASGGPRTYNMSGTAANGPQSARGRRMLRQQEQDARFEQMRKDQEAAMAKRDAEREERMRAQAEETQQRLREMAEQLKAQREKAAQEKAEQEKAEQEKAEQEKADAPAEEKSE